MADGESELRHFQSNRSAPACRVEEPLTPIALYQQSIRKLCDAKAVVKEAWESIPCGDRVGLMPPELV